MARVTHVKHARQRFKMVPLTNLDGTPKRVQVMRGSGVPKLTKRGQPIFQTQSVPDKTQPLPNHHCGKCNVEIKPGDPYKWIAPRSGPYGGRKLYRCAACPTWQVWEYSDSLSAKTARIIDEGQANGSEIEDAADMEAHLQSVAEEIRELAQEKRDSAESLESGFGHPTSQSEELTEIADSLDSWADEVESTDIPEIPEECTEEHDREENDELDCGICRERDEFDLDSWRDDILSSLDNCPV